MEIRREPRRTEGGRTGVTRDEKTILCALEDLRLRNYRLSRGGNIRREYSCASLDSTLTHTTSAPNKQKPSLRASFVFGDSHVSELQVELRGGTRASRVIYVPLSSLYPLRVLSNPSDRSVPLRSPYGPLASRCAYISVSPRDRAVSHTYILFAEQYTRQSATKIQLSRADN